MCVVDMSVIPIYDTCPACAHWQMGGGERQNIRAIVLLCAASIITLN